jgi:hypothetical protein
MEYVLIDPADFCIGLREAAKMNEAERIKNGIPKLKLINEMFTEELAEKIKEEYSLENSTRKVLFLSDIRSADGTIMTIDEQEERIWFKQPGQYINDIKKYILAVDKIK